MAPPAKSYKILFKITGSNDFGADTGTLSLIENGRVIATSDAFSGGVKSPAASSPIPTSTYRIRLDIRQTVDPDKPSKDDTDDHMHHWYGIEKIDDPGWQWEWGSFRAALNEKDSHMPQEYRGNFLHGKKRPDDYTHGCICERSERILTRLWALRHIKAVSVEVKR